MEAPELGTLAYHGINLDNVNSSKQAVTDCPFCGKENHFFVSTAKGKVGTWQCKSCGLAGNRYVFLKLWYDHCLQATTTADYKNLMKARKFSGKTWEMFEQDSLAYDHAHKRWLIPVYNAEGSLVDLQTWRVPKEGEKSHLQHTKGCKAHINGMENLGKDGPIFITEGRWDAITLAYFFPEVDKRENYSILAVPGWDSLCADDIKGKFTNRDIVLLYDSGLVGPETKKAPTWAKHAALLRKEHKARSIQVIKWPESYPANYDISDLIREKGPEDAWKLVTAYTHSPTERLTPEGLKVKVDLSGVLKAFKESGVHLTKDFTDAMKVTFAGVASVQLGGKPLWLFLIAPPGAGKSLILESTLGSHLCEYQTNLRYTSLVSGFKTSDGEDPSLLNKLGNRSLVVKDYTTILEKAEVQQKELLSLLKEAYDGRITIDYGNGVRRSYPDPASGLDYWYFSFVAGVTPSIHKHIKASMGDAQRFLKISMHGAVKTQDIIRRAINNTRESYLEAQKANVRQDAVASFLDMTINVDKPPTVSEKWQDQIVYLTQFAIICRAHLEREKGGDLIYEASTESGARLGEQLTKLAQSLAIVHGEKHITDEVFRLVRKTAWDTAYGWRRNVFAVLHANANTPLPSRTVSKKAKLTISTTQRVLTDLEDLGAAYVATKESSGGKPAFFWKLTPFGKEIAQKSLIFQ